MDDPQSEEASDFDSETIVEHMKEVFEFFGQDILEWTLCSIADNCDVNKKVARLLRVPHVGCLSHKLNLEVNHMVDSTSKVHETMMNCKCRLRNRDLQRNLTTMATIIHNATR